jgi:beta-galactosidase
MTCRVDEYIAASGAHIVRAYKENIERARRTEGLAGIQLLDIRDFPGQGHATTGILDMFWDSKGLVEPNVFAQSNGAQTLLMQAPSRTVRGGTAFLVDLELSNFGAHMTDIVVQWEILTHSERHAAGELTVTMARSGQITSLGQLRLDTPADQAHTWLLKARVGDITNEWNFWSFPEIDASQPHPNVSCNIPSLRGLLLDADFSDDYSGSMLNVDRRGRHPDWHLAISSHLTYPLLQYLSDGGRVWLMLSAESLYDYVPSRYLPPFWSYLHFPDNVSTVMGMIIHMHQALERFPHDGTSDWHWYHLVNDAPALCLDSVPNLSPMIEVIDNFNRAKRLTYMFEASVGKGKLLVSTLRFLQPAVMQKPEARWLFDLLREHISGDAFAPQQRLSIGELLGLVHLTNQRPTGFVD